MGDQPRYRTDGSDRIVWRRQTRSRSWASPSTRGETNFEARREAFRAVVVYLGGNPRARDGGAGCGLLIVIGFTANAEMKSRPIVPSLEIPTPGGT